MSLTFASGAAAAGLQNLIGLCTRMFVISSPPLRGDGGQVPIRLFMSCCPVAVFHSIVATGCKNDHIYLPRLDL